MRPATADESQPGSRVPPHCTGIGKMLLASGSALENVLLETAAEALLEKTITDRGDCWLN